MKLSILIFLFTLLVYPNSQLEYVMEEGRLSSSDLALLEEYKKTMPRTSDARKQCLGTCYAEATFNYLEDQFFKHHQKDLSVSRVHFFKLIALNNIDRIFSSQNKNLSLFSSGNYILTSEMLNKHKIDVTDKLSQHEMYIERKILSEVFSKLEELFSQYRKEYYQKYNNLINQGFIEDFVLKLELAHTNSQDHPLLLLRLKMIKEHMKRMKGTRDVEKTMMISLEELQEVLDQSLSSTSTKPGPIEIPSGDLDKANSITLDLRNFLETNLKILEDLKGKTRQKTYEAIINSFNDAIKVKHKRISKKISSFHVEQETPKKNGTRAYTISTTSFSDFKAELLSMEIYKNAFIKSPGIYVENMGMYKATKNRKKGTNPNFSGNHLVFVEDVIKNESGEIIFIVAKDSQGNSFGTYGRQFIHHSYFKYLRLNQMRATYLKGAPRSCIIRLETLVR